MNLFARGEDEEIRLTVRKAPIKALPFAALIAFVSWQGAAVFVAAFIFTLGVEQNSSEMHQTGAEGLQHLAGLQVSGTTSLPAITDTWTGTSCCVPSG